MRENETTKENKGGQSNPFIVAEGVPYEQLEQVALECVEHFLNETKAAFCQVWPTQVDFDARHSISADLLSCWLYYVGVPLNGGDPMIQGPTAVDYHVEGCPGGAVPPLS